MHNTFTNNLQSVAEPEEDIDVRLAAIIKEVILDCLRKNDVERAIMTEELGRKFLDVDCIYIKDLGNYEEYFANE